MKNGFIILCFFGGALCFVPFLSSAEEEEDIIWLDDEEDNPSAKETGIADSKSDPSPPISEKTDDLDEEEFLEEFQEDTTKEEIADKKEPTGPSQEEVDLAQVEENLNEEDSAQELDLSSPSPKNPPSQATTTTADDEYEQNLYETYTQYYSKKVSAEEWNSIAGDKDTYTIQNKDTLWDISQMLFNDAHYWPKLWAVNPSLGNPHLIQPQDILGVVHGTEGSPPYLTMVQKGGADEGTAQPGFLSGQKTGLQVGGKPKPVINIPSSLPPLYLRKKKAEQISGEINAPPSELNAMSILPYYMTSKPLSAVGTVVDKKDFGSWFHVGQSVLLEMRESVNPGQKLTIMKGMGKLYSSTLGVRGPFGYQQQVQGEVEVVGRVPDSFDLYEARVTKSLNPLTLKASVVGHSLVQFSHQPTDVTGTGEAQIIGVPTIFENEKKLASPSDFVYLNRGKGSGLAVGQMYQVKANLGIQTRTKKYGYDIKVGEVKIVHTEDRFATALIINMHNPIHVGDYISPLSQGLSTQKNYDPFDDADIIEEKGPPPAQQDSSFGEFEDFGDAVETVEKEPSAEEAIEPDPDEEDMFEAFE